MCLPDVQEHRDTHVRTTRPTSTLKRASGNRCWSSSNNTRHDTSGARCNLWGAAAASSDPNAGWLIFPISGLWGLGILVLVVGLTILLIGRIRARRGDLVSSTPDIESTTGRMRISIAVHALAWVLQAGFTLALYGFFGNRAGTKARQLGLIGVVLNLVLLYWFMRS